MRRQTHRLLAATAVALGLAGCDRRPPDAAVESRAERERREAAELAKLLEPSPAEAEMRRRDDERRAAVAAREAEKQAREFAEWKARREYDRETVARVVSLATGRELTSADRIRVPLPRHPRPFTRAAAPTAAPTALKGRPVVWNVALGEKAVFVADGPTSRAEVGDSDAVIFLVERYSRHLGYHRFTRSEEYQPSSAVGIPVGPKQTRYVDAEVPITRTGYRVWVISRSPVADRGVFEVVGGTVRREATKYEGKTYPGVPPHGKEADVPFDSAADRALAAWVGSRFADPPPLLDQFLALVNPPPAPKDQPPALPRPPDRVFPPDVAGEPFEVTIARTAESDRIERAKKLAAELRGHPPETWAYPHLRAALDREWEPTRYDTLQLARAWVIAEARAGVPYRAAGLAFGPRDESEFRSDPEKFVRHWQARLIGP